MSNIPVRNLYYLLAYAWNKLEEAETVDVSTDGLVSALELLSSILAQGTAHVLRRGLDRGYRTETEAYWGVRGRMLLTETISRGLIGTGQTICEVDELTHDITHNQILKATLRLVLVAADLQPPLSDAIHVLYHRFTDVADVRLRPEMFRRVQLHRNNAVYALVLDACELLYYGLLPDQTGNGYVFRDFTRDDRAMARLFQAFVRNFYSREQRSFRVSSPQLQWLDADGSDEDLKLLPGMQTDITLSGANRRIILDTKYYVEALQTNYGKQTVRSEHLYQILAYLTNSPSSGWRAEGLLLYPEVDRRLRVEYTMQGYRIRFATVNLANPWSEVRSELLSLVA